MGRPRKDRSDLSKREREVLALILRGMRNGEIAEALGLTVRTVKYHVTNILEKTDAANRLQLMARYATRGLGPCK